jgi:hypothetical protein
VWLDVAVQVHNITRTRSTSLRESQIDQQSRELMSRSPYLRYVALCTVPVGLAAKATVSLLACVPDSMCGNPLFKHPHERHPRLRKNPAVEADVDRGCWYGCRAAQDAWLLGAGDEVEGLITTGRSNRSWSGCGSVFGASRCAATCASTTPTLR